MNKKRKRGKETSGRDRERTRKKGTTHNTQKNEDFLLENDPGGWTQKQEIFYQQHSRGQSLSRFIASLIRYLPL